MNICETRCRKTWVRNLDANWEDLPHEPKSEHRFVMKPVKQNKIDSLEWTGDYAVCKHCGSIFATVE